MKKLNRWVYAAFGVVILLFAGMVYAWSVLSGPIAQEYPQWTNAQLSLTFTIVMTLFCVGCMAGGFLSGKVSAKIYVWAAAAMFLGGFMLSARITSLMGLYIGFGVICGFASGLAYNAVMGTISRWFPDKQGLISGVLLMGFGLSSFLVGKIFQMCTPETIGAWRQSFTVFGVITAVVLAICAFFVEKPPADYQPPAAGKQAKRWVNPVAMEAATGTMVRKPAFWLYYLWAILLSAAGLALVSQASGIAREIGTDVSAGTIATVVGLISICNGVGRVILGALFDKAGRSKTMQTVNVLFLLTCGVLILSLSLKSFPILVVGFILGGFSYGGVTPTNSAFVSSYYGLKHFPLNFSIINTNLIIASFGSTIAGALYDASRSFFSTDAMIGVLALLGIFVSLAINICDKRTLAAK